MIIFEGEEEKRFFDLFWARKYMIFIYSIA